MSPRNVYSRPEVIGKKSIVLEGKEIHYTLRKSRFSDLIRLAIRSATGLVVTVPHQYNMNGLDDILLQRSAWILKHQNKMNANRFVLEDGLHDGQQVPYLGKLYTLRIKEGGERGHVSLAENTIHLLTGGKTPVEVMEKWYRHRAAGIVKTCLEKNASKMGLSFGRLCIRAQKTRWGSCTSMGDLNFNWKLATIPPEVMDYVVIHELSHRVEMNHTDRFWVIVEKYCPNWKALRKQLKTYE
ncbi:M48 family metallopeptidase [Dehalococcoides mccartyi]|uniref:M48 family metallopeptidase n=1 Tax=Dehalococcoides mccartyi TaxID=61435 RepID=UPI0001BDC6C3|nr:SprT family zinc-dependent metalloprotease [Dehalococcoides mccartyi]AQU05282.1 hypothetical protein B1777_00770 [Dehalococcoides mccartyi]AQU06735.1 hypothetical protein B1778_00625 [Dehalococcoides mccartyi]AQW61872.1 hypothetical protein B1779_00870 [Dehalococcoides mccartyi]AQX72690.1 hypothetical protein B1775_00610 [Dehalococcoides mccartyi]OBW62857.1 MAG: hypothetical protein A9183_00305 [Dehalococcoides mccartyi]